MRCFFFTDLAMLLTLTCATVGVEPVAVVAATLGAPVGRHTALLTGVVVDTVNAVWSNMRIQLIQSGVACCE